jgi:hypothetical protein
MALTEEQQGQIYEQLADKPTTLGTSMADVLSKSIRNGDRANVQNILSRNYKGSLLRGGKRKRKTMKKRHRRTRKKMKGGYIYSTSKELDKSSSIISATSNSKSSTSKSSTSKSSTSKSNKKDKTKRKYYK